MTECGPSTPARPLSQARNPEVVPHPPSSLSFDPVHVTSGTLPECERASPCPRSMALVPARIVSRLSRPPRRVAHTTLSQHCCQHRPTETIPWRLGTRGRMPSAFGQQIKASQHPAPACLPDLVPTNPCPVPRFFTWTLQRQAWSVQPRRRFRRSHARAGGSSFGLAQLQPPARPAQFVRHPWLPVLSSSPGLVNAQE